MAIGTCRLLAIEGAHGTGKTTLAHALAAYFKEHSVNAGVVADAARRSPFVEDAVLHAAADFSLSAELHLFATHIAEEQLQARQYELLICDRTIANVLAYTDLLVKVAESDVPILAAMRQLASAYASNYDGVFFLSDSYALSLTNDPYRPTDAAFQAQANDAIRSQCRSLGITLLDVPAGLQTHHKVRFVVKRFGFR